MAVSPMAIPIMARRRSDEPTTPRTGEAGCWTATVTRQAKSMYRLSPRASMRYSGQWWARARAIGLFPARELGIERHPVVAVAAMSKSLAPVGSR